MMKHKKPRTSPKSIKSKDQLEKKLLKARTNRKVIETIDFILEKEWVDHKKVLKVVQGILGKEAVKVISKSPKAWFDQCSVIMYREKKNVLQVSTMGMSEKHYIELNDRESKLVEEIAKIRKSERSLKRKRQKEARCKEENQRKKSKTGTNDFSVPDGAHIKIFKLEECCAIYSDSEFAKEMGVLNKGIKVKLDLTTMRSNSVRMVFPLRCWVNSEEMPLSPDEVRKYETEDMSDDESELDEEKQEILTNEKEVVVGSCITFDICRVYRRKNSNNKFEIGTLHKGNRIEYNIGESGEGWVSVLAPLPGWIQYKELSQPLLENQKQESLNKETKVKESPIDLTADSAVSEVSSAESENGEKSGEKKDAKKPKDVKSSKKKDNESLNKSTKKQDTIETDSNETVNSTEKPEEELSEIEKVDVQEESEHEEECTDDDWEEFEDPDVESLTGNWSCGQKGGCFTLNQLEDGVLDGYLENKETCSIDGKVEGANVVFNQNWQKGSVHGLGVVTVVKGTHSDNMRIMDVNFEFTNKKGKKVTGKNMLYKDPACDITGIWYAEEDKLGYFVFKMSKKGKITGFVDSEKSCKISGRVTAHHIIFKQSWQVKPSKESGFTEEFLRTSVEGFVNDNGSKMCLKYIHPKPDGTRVSGNIVIRRKTARALAGLWVSGDQGGRFVFEVCGGQSFTGYLDANDTCRFHDGVINGFSISFRQVWLSGSAHKGAVAQVEGKANNAFTKLDLTYTCKKKGGKAIKGKSTLNKLEFESNTKIFHNECFNGIHSAFPPNVFKQFDGFKMFGHHSGENRFPLYTRTQKILILGEADFSFTLAMMRSFKRSFSTIIGTSYMRKWGHGKPPPSWNSDPKKRQFLNESQKKLDPTLDEIVERGGFCRFGVDARDLEATLYSDDHSGKWCGKIPKIKFDRIIFPFPRASLSRFDRVDDTDLMRGTFRSCQKMLNSTGELHTIMHTAREGVAQFDRWKIRDLAEQENLVWRAALPFDPKKMPAYNPKDVTGKPWRPYEPRVHVFTPQHSEWRPECRSWRH